MPCKGDILEVCEDEGHCCDARVATGSSEGGEEEVAQVHSRRAGAENNSCSESYGFQGERSRGGHGERVTRAEEKKQRKERRNTSTDMKSKCQIPDECDTLLSSASGRILLSINADMISEHVTSAPLLLNKEARKHDRMQFAKLDIFHHELFPHSIITS